MAELVEHEQITCHFTRCGRFTEFAERPFPARFPFRGGSWPVPLMMAWYNFQDRLSMRE